APRRYAGAGYSPMTERSGILSDGQTPRALENVAVQPAHRGVDVHYDQCDAEHQDGAAEECGGNGGQNGIPARAIDQARVGVVSGVEPFVRLERKHERL